MRKMKKTVQQYSPELRAEAVRLYNVQNLQYVWDSVGNLNQRQDLNQNLTEIFAYDALNRPTSSTLNGVQNFSAGYTDLSGNDRGGNVMSRSDGAGPVRTFDYTAQQPGCSYSGLPPQPHAVRNVGGGAFVYCYDRNGNVIQRNGLSISWSSYNLPTFLQATSAGTTYSSQFLYGPDHQRYQQNATYSNGTEVTSYAGALFEKVTGTAMGGAINYRHYVPTPSGLTVVINRTASSSSTTYALSDHLGSSDALVSGTTGQIGNVLVRESFGAFGQRRSSNWSAGGPSTADWTTIANTTRRGFTFQEELDNINLVHMNGRVYDPNVGRFLSVDPLIGDLGDSGAVNAYAYVSNRPLTATDPSGFDGEDGGDMSVVSVVGHLGQGLADGAQWLGQGIVDLFSGLGGLFHGSKPPPPLAVAVQNQSAENGISVNSYNANGGLGQSGSGVGGWVDGGGEIDSGTGAELVGTLTVQGTPPSQSAIGSFYFGWGTIASIEPAPPGADYVETVTVVAQKAPRSMAIGPDGQIKVISGEITLLPGMAAEKLAAGGIGALSRLLQAERGTATAARQIDAAWGATKYGKGGLMSGIEHIMYRHGFNSGFSNVSRFAKGTRLRDISNYVDKALRYGRVTPIGPGAYEVEYSFGKHVIGTGIAGQDASSIRVFVRGGIIQTAFPF